MLLSQKRYLRFISKTIYTHWNMLRTSDGFKLMIQNWNIAVSYYIVPLTIEWLMAVSLLTHTKFV